MSPASRLPGDPAASDIPSSPGRCGSSLVGGRIMRHLAAFLLAASAASAYITPPDQVLIDGRMLLTGSRPLATFPWQGERPRLSEHPNETASDSREVAALWEIRDGRLWLLAVSAFRFDGFAPRRSVGLRDLMPERIQDGRVFAEWFTGDFEVIERERVEGRLALRPGDVPRERVVVRKYRVARGHVAEESPPRRNADSRQSPIGHAREAKAQFERHKNERHPWKKGTPPPRSFAEAGLLEDAKIVWSDLYLDGGTRGYLIMDSAGMFFAVCTGPGLQVADHPKRVDAPARSRLFVGGLHYTDAEIVPAKGESENWLRTIISGKNANSVNFGSPQPAQEAR